MTVRRKFVVAPLALAALGVLLIAGVRVARAVRPGADGSIPSAPVRRTQVAFSITARGELQGGHSHTLNAPMTGSGELILTELRKPGELVRRGDVVARFDTTEEAYRLREAESDLAEADQQVLQAENESKAREAELTAELIKARGAVRVAEIECRRNPLLATLSAKQNDVTLTAARERLAKLEHDFPERRAAARAAIALQSAGRKKAEVQAGTARRNIDNMALKAPAEGYIGIERNTNSNWYFTGMVFPLYQVGDSVRPGVQVAQIPDLATWEINARISEVDRGQISNGQPARVEVIAVPGKTYQAKVTNMGGTQGPPWDRRFECKLALENAGDGLRPGMSARILIETGKLENVLAIPAQALFERDGRPYVYLKTGAAFVARDIKLVRRSESQVVIEGVNEGQEVALANPDDRAQRGQKGGAGKALPQ